MRQRFEKVRLLFILAIGVVGLAALPSLASAAPLYKLPYPAGISYIVSLGNFTPPHIGSENYAVDFAMPVGSTIVAVRSGTVKYVKEDSQVCGCSSAYGNAGNYIVVAHGDGTQALYLHLQYNGALAKVGDHVDQGQPIAKSGMTGWTCGSAAGGCGPHLHFQVEQTGIWFTWSLPVLFADVSTNGGVPRAGISYRSGNTQTTAPPPSAGCSGAGCTGQDPVDAGCGGDAMTVATQNVSFGTSQTVRVELRWSATCQTNWARAQIVSGPTTSTLAVHLEDTSGATLGSTLTKAAGPAVYGPMQYAPTQQVAACVAVASPVKGSVCTKAM